MWLRKAKKEKKLCCYLNHWQYKQMRKASLLLLVGNIGAVGASSGECTCTDAIAKLTARYDGALEAVLSRLAALEARHSTHAGSAKHLSSRRSILESPSNNMPTRIDGASMATSSVEASFVEAGRINVATINITRDVYITGQLFWHNIPVGFNAPTLAPTVIPTLPPTPLPSNRPTIKPTTEPTLLPTLGLTVTYEPASGTSGWTNTESKCPDFHGPWGNDLKVNSKIFALPAPHKMVRIMGTIYAIGSRDGENDGLRLDGNQVYYATSNYMDYSTTDPSVCVNTPQVYDSSHVLAYSQSTPVAYLGSSSTSMCFAPGMTASYQGICARQFDLTIAHSSSSLTVEFYSNIDQSLSDEGWGFGTFQIFALR